MCQNSYTLCCWFCTGCYWPLECIQLTISKQKVWMRGINSGVAFTMPSQKHNEFTGYSRWWYSTWNRWQAWDAISEIISITQIHLLHQCLQDAANAVINARIGSSGDFDSLQIKMTMLKSVGIHRNSCTGNDVDRFILILISRSVFKARAF